MMPCFLIMACIGDVAVSCAVKQAIPAPDLTLFMRGFVWGQILGRRRTTRGVCEANNGRHESLSWTPECGKWDWEMVRKEILRIV